MKSETKRWREKWRDEQWDSEMKKWRGPQIYQAKSSAISFSGKSKTQVAQTDLKHILVLEFLKLDEIFEIRKIL